LNVGDIEKMRKLVDLAANRKLVLLILILVATDLSVLWNIPFLRQIFGFIFLTIIPGLLILYLLKLNKLDFTTKFVLSVGCSASFLMFYGLLINNLSLILGYETPLSTVPLLISFNIAFIVLAIKTFDKSFIKTSYHEKIGSFGLKNWLPKLNLSTTEKAFLVVPILFPALSIFGMHIMNTTDNNIILMFLLFLIPIYVAFVCFFNNKISDRLYPLAIFLIGISVLLLMSLRSNHLIGVDTHIEYHLFQLVVTSQHWQVFGESLLDTCLAISLLPAIYHFILNTNPEYLFKVLFSLLFSISPLIVYLISKKYVGSFYAFIASFFFISVSGFGITPLWARSNLAALFFGLAIMVIVHPDIKGFSKKVLFITFMGSIIVSHYSTSYICLYLFLLVVIVAPLLAGFTHWQMETTTQSNVPAREGDPVASSWFKTTITLSTVALFFVMLFFWYSQITGSAFTAGVRFLEETISQMQYFFVLESRGSGVEAAFGISETLHTQIPTRILFFSSWATIAFIAIGVLTTLGRFREKILLKSGDEKSKHPQRIDAEYFLLSLACCTMLVTTLVLPHVAVGYSMERQYIQAMFPLSLFLVIGGIKIAKYVRLKPYWILIIVLIPYFLCTTGAMYQVFGIPTAITLNSEGPLYDAWYINDSDCYGAKWLGTNSEEHTRINTYSPTMHLLYSQAGIRTVRRVNMLSSFDEDEEIRGYIFHRSRDVIDGKLMDDGSKQEHNITEYKDKFFGQAKIYDNGGSEVWI